MVTKNDIERVHFYPVNDMAYPYEVDKIVNRLKSINPFRTMTDLNDVMELWNIHQYFKQNIFPPNLEEVDKEYLNEINIRLQGIIVQSMTKWPKDRFEIDYEKLSFDYKHNFWKVIVETNTYKSFPKPVLMNCIMESSKYILRSILIEKDIVTYLDKELTAFIKGYIPAVEVLLSNYYVSRGPQNEKVYFPKALSLHDREELILNYIASTERNLNYLRIINSVKNDNTLSISDRTRLICKRAEQEENERVFKDGHTMSYKIGVSVDFKKYYPIIELTPEVTKYNLACLNHLDARGIVLLFKNIFGYIDQFGTIPLVSLEHEDRIFDIFGLRGVSWYRDTPTFLRKNKIAIMQLIAAEEGLKLYGKSIESTLSSVIDWINSTYNVNFRFNPLFEIGPTIGKIRHLFAEMDSIIRQYQLYVEDGNIDYELLGISSSPLGLNQIKSVTDPMPKYLTLKPDSSEVKYLQHLLSSKDTIFSKKGDSGYKNLHFQIKHGFSPELKSDSQKGNIQRMIDKGILTISIEGQYEITPVGDLLNILYHRDFAQINRLPTTIHECLAELETKGWIEYTSSLLHISEANYFNYWLNRKDFTNGYDLRNKYMHGTQPYEESIESDYQIAKLLFILLLLKIIDDLESKKI